MIALLKALGLMRVSELLNLFGRKKAEDPTPAQAPAPEIDWEAKFKRAATDLAAQAEEIEGLRGDVVAAEKAADDFKRKLIDAEHEIAAYSNGAKILHDAIEALTPDAQKWRDYLKRSRDRKAGRK